MKSVTASEARKNWFTLLDEAAAGKTIVIDRNGKRLILRSETSRSKPPSYHGLIGGKGLNEADQWSWDWTASGKLRPVRHK
jgi:hypothetical protein